MWAQAAVRHVCVPSGCGIHHAVHLDFLRPIVHRSRRRIVVPIVVGPRDAQRGLFRVVSALIAVCALFPPARALPTVQVFEHNEEENADGTEPGANKHQVPEILHIIRQSVHVVGCLHHFRDPLEDLIHVRIRGLLVGIGGVVHDNRQLVLDQRLLGLHVAAGSAHFQGKLLPLFFC